MNWKRLTLVILAVSALAALLVWATRRSVVDEHRQARQLILYYTLSRVQNPVIVVGDSIVEASTLPRSVCGHPIVNAGLNGASTASDLGNWLSAALDGKRAASIVMSLGTNDALKSSPESVSNFETRYGALLAQISKLAPQTTVLEIPPVQAQGRMSTEMRDEVMKTIHAYNAVLPDLAKRHGAAFVALPAMAKPHTIDGVHLNSEGYLAWDKAALQAATAVCS